MGSHILRLATMLAGLLFTVSGSMAAVPDGPAVGEAVHDAVHIAGKRVPLPVGRWIVAARDRSAEFDAAKGAYGAIEHMVLLAVDDASKSATGLQRVRGVAEIHTNLMPTADGWGLPSECRRENLFLVVLKHDTGWDGSCLFLASAFAVDAAAADGASAVVRQTAAFARANALALPAGWIVAGFRVTDRQDFIDLRLHVDPRDAGMPSVGRWGRNGDAWLNASVIESPARRDYLLGMASWAIAASETVERGLRNAASAETLTWPGNGAADAVPDSEKQRVLADLKALLAAGILDEEAYSAQVALVEAQPTPGSEGKGWVSHAMKKNISFRVFGGAVDWILAFSVTLNSPLSSWITATIIAVHSVIFVANDNYWNDYWAERGRRQGAPMLDLRHFARTV